MCDDGNVRRPHCVPILICAPVAGTQQLSNEGADDSVPAADGETGYLTLQVNREGE